MKRGSRSTWLLGSVVFLCLMLLYLPAHAGPYVSRGPFVSPDPGPIIPGPENVPGKEYSNHRDENAAGAADPEQNIMWDGAGGIADTFDYGGSGEVDAIANNGDALFSSVIKNTSALLFSVTGDPNIYYESRGGAGGKWATPADINQDGVDDVDGLEVWGPEGSDDADRYSLAGDPGGTAVFAYDSGTGTSSPFITNAQIAAAIGWTGSTDYIDLDAMMTNGEMIMFSIAPIAGAFDGGEIWVWDGVNPASFLFHGGHLWDTAFDVSGTFGLNSENINALEAVSTVPEPSSYLLLGSGIAALAAWRRRRMRKKC